MTRPIWRVLLLALLVVTAGCVGGLAGDGASTDPAENDGANDHDGEDTVDEGDGDETNARMAFYLSDEPNAMDDFEHLNVTVTKVGLKPAGDDAGGDEADDETDGEDTEDDEENVTESDDEGATTGTETAETEADDAEAEGEGDDEAEGDDGAEADDGENDENDGKAGWLEYEVDETTVDLTELRGANASRLDVLEIPEGEYESVFVYVSDVDGVLTDGTEQRVKLPSGKLKVQKPFSVQAGEEVDFVFDITVHEAGKSGKYILQPVISETGTGDEVEIRDVNAEDEDADDDADEATDEGDADEAADEGDDETNDAGDENAGEDGANSDGEANAAGEANGDGGDALLTAA